MPSYRLQEAKASSLSELLENEFSRLRERV